MFLTVILPILFLVLIGYLSVNWGLLTPEQIKSLGTFVMKVALPAFLLHALLGQTFEEVWKPKYFLIYGFASLVIFFASYYILKRFFHQRLTSAVIFSFGAAMSNTGLIGTAIVPMVVGKDAVAYLAHTILFESLILTTLVLFLTDSHAYEKTAFPLFFRKVVYNALHSPLVLSILIAFSCLFLDISLPKVLDETLEVLGQAAAPIALFMIGGGLAGVKVKRLDGLALCPVIFKVILMPALIFLLFYSFSEDKEMMRIATLIAVLPMPTLFQVLGHIYGIEKRALNASIISTVLGLVIASTLILVWWS
ncbi:AEC family transporter [Acinetobacter pollinis]|uniref:AEC family transporter n=1 Tax=Acinetobacter pollinis TaxID=2605270 RepID=A0ABU6DRK7_9GAMM|nr:AEC family transporter [Acinetobacter pollinis]MEB5476489.1 AEC family transporter [Acinetobacter pollinis]